SRVLAAVLAAARTIRAARRLRRPRCGDLRLSWSWTLSIEEIESGLDLAAADRVIDHRREEDHDERPPRNVAWSRPLKNRGGWSRALSALTTGLHLSPHQSCRNAAGQRVREELVRDIDHGPGDSVLEQV